jgi:hypothetical protein
MVSATLVSFKLLAGKPMECWVPAEYEKGWEDYAGEQRCLYFVKANHVCRNVLLGKEYVFCALA